MTINAGRAQTDLQTEAALAEERFILLSAGHVPFLDGGDRRPLDPHSQIGHRRKSHEATRAWTWVE
jgi:hypothetical protein